MAYACKTAKKNIDFFFSDPIGSNRKKDRALMVAIFKHMTVGSTLGNHIVSCQKCWDYYKKMKKRYCGG